MKSSSSKPLVIIGTLDTKGAETAFLRDRLHSLGWKTRVIDTGLLAPPAFKPEVPREEVAARTGKTIEELLSEGKDKVDAVNAMAQGALSILEEWLHRGEVGGVIALGGGVGTWLGTTVMRSLPLGLPKVMVSTLPFQDIRPILGTKDIVLFPSVADILGLNPLLRNILRNAASALAGMAGLPPAEETQKKVIGSTSLGITTPAILASRRILEENGYEMTCYHANGYGGRAFEEGISSGMFLGVLDLTTHEITNQLFKGTCIAGEDRLETAGRKGIPQLVAPGALDVISKGPIETLSAEERKRPHYRHSPFFTHVRVSHEQMRQVGEVMAKKLNLSQGPAAVAIPLRGFSDQNRPGGLFYNPEADGEFLTTLKKQLSSKVPIVEVDAHMNDEAFAVKACQLLERMMEAIGGKG
ncbi:MAG: hypothetical protein A2156_04865 [Deltaproteobacteria bacterium RBG_16_48_10]|nr:MAG: hypothetical protein A2156_04865 [Deltaproteobacteria bacterium RBG_16_48_10]